MHEKRNDSQDVEPDIIPLLSWDGKDDSRGESIKVLYEGVQDKYQSVVEWYMRRKNSKRIMAQLLRILSIILLTFAVAGLMITTINAGESWVKWVGLASSVLMVLAGGLVVFDRFFGYSSSWIRFVLTAMVLQKHLNKFQTDMNYLLLAKGLDDQDRLKRMLERIQQAYDFLYTRLQNEAQQWAEEFSSNLDRSISELAEELGLKGDQKLP